MPNDLPENEVDIGEERELEPQGAATRWWAFAVVMFIFASFLTGSLE